MSQPLPNLASNYRAQHAGGAGSSSEANSSSSVVPDHLFFNVVRLVPTNTHKIQLPIIAACV